MIGVDTKTNEDAAMLSCDRSPHVRSRLRCRVIVPIGSAVLVLTASSVFAQRAGLVEFSVGDVVAESANGGVRSLVKNSEVLSGDRIKTRNGRAQVRFATGAFI